MNTGYMSKKLNLSSKILRGYTANNNKDDIFEEVKLGNGD
jgi:hypothetical protein